MPVSLSYQTELTGRVKTKKMKVSAINPVPTEEVLDFAKSVGATDLSVDYYSREDGVVWGCYNESYEKVGQCDATGAEVEELKTSLRFKP